MNTDKQILIAAHTGIGNAISLFPMIRTLKKKFPHSLIDIISPNKYGTNDLFSLDDDIHQVFTSLPNKNYHIFINPYFGRINLLSLKLKMKKLCVRHRRCPCKNMPNRTYGRN